LDKVSLAAMATAKPAIPAEAKTALTGMPECSAALYKRIKMLRNYLTQMTSRVTSLANRF
jgi:hypothetical protein